MIRVVCWKWRNTGPKRNRIPYGPAHVNIFAAMVRRHLSMPHEVVCVTDEPEGIDPTVRIVPLWDDGLREKGACYVRLKAFAEEMREVIGPRFVSIDLDCVILDSLDPLLDRDDPFVIWRNVGSGSRHCGSMFMMTAGAVSEVWDRFDPADLERRHGPVDRSHSAGRYVHPEAIAAGNVIGSDQAWISTVLPNAAQWARRDGVLSFKTHVAPHWGRRPKFRRNREIPQPEGRIVFFHGEEDPSMPAVQKAAPWVAQHWRP